MLTEIEQILRAVPDVIWSAVIASALTLAGVLLSNASNTKRLRLQLTHDAGQRSLDRLTNARRAVYLEAVEKFAAVMGQLGQIPQLDPRHVNIAAPLQEFNSAAAKIQLIAESNTASLAADTSSRLLTLFFTLMAKAQPVFDLHIEIEIKDSMYQKSQVELDRILKRRQTIVEAPQFEKAEYEALESSFRFWQGQADQYANERNAALAKRLDLQKQFAVELVAEAKQLSEAQLALAIAMRGELELGTDELELRDRFERGARSASAALKAMIKRMKD